MWLFAPNITCTHGFTDRHGGVSQPPFDSLNMGGHEDNLLHISENRNMALTQIGVTEDMVCRLKQVHGTKVQVAQTGLLEGDGLVTRESHIVLAIATADCYPILFHDANHHVIGAAHAGWRGTVGKIVNEVIQQMKQLGAQTESIQVAIGPGISTNSFEVGPEVIEQFRENGFPETCLINNHIDLVGANLFVLSECGIPTANIYVNGRCSTEPDFFSYRRDKGLTGRMWAVIALQQ